MEREEQYKAFNDFLVKKIREDEKVEGRRYVALVNKSRATIDTFNRGNDVYEVDLALPPFEIRYLRQGDLFVILNMDENDTFLGKHKFPTILKANNTPRKSNSSITSNPNDPFKVSVDIVKNATLYVTDTLLGEEGFVISENI